MISRNVCCIPLKAVRLTAILLLAGYVLSVAADPAINAVQNNGNISEDATQENIPELQHATLNKTERETVFELYAEQWELAHDGESILAIPVLNRLINAWLKERELQIEIQYPGGEEGEYWVHELTDWLVSLGIPSDTMVTVPASGADDIIKFDLIK